MRFAQGPWAAPDAEKAKKNPLPDDKKFVEQGAKLAQVNCVTCHGAKGKGDGAAAVALNPKPADWTLEARAGRKRRRALLEDLQRPGPDAAVEASPRAGSLGADPVYPLAEVGAAGLVGRRCPTEGDDALRRRRMIGEAFEGESNRSRSTRCSATSAEPSRRCGICCAIGNENDARDAAQDAPGWVPASAGSGGDALSSVEEVLSIPAAGSEPQELFTLATDRICRLLGADRVMLFAAEGSHLRPRSARGFRRDDLDSIVVEAGEGIVGRAFSGAARAHRPRASRRSRTRSSSAFP